jgi:AcrR family transcriptional regulator
VFIRSYKYPLSVGHRERLLAAAKQCLYEHGYARTTARDIVAASGTNLASIGYHFGSKDALLVAAMSEAMTEWGTELARAIAGAQVAEEPTLAGRMESAVGELVRTLAKHRRLWMVTFEIYPQIDRLPQLRLEISKAHQRARQALAALLLGIAEDQLDEQAIRTIGAFFFALVSGLVTQWLLDPERMPDAAEVISTIRMATTHTRIAG